MSAPIELTVDKEFKDICWSLEGDEETNLRISLKEHGCKQPVEYWAHNGQNIVIHGYNRKRICEELGLPFPVAELSINDRTHAVVEICREQLGRRNVSPAQRTHLIGKLVDSLAAKRQQVTGNEAPEELADLFRPVAQTISEQTGVSTSTVEKAIALNKAVAKLEAKAPPLARAAKDGEIAAADAVKLARLAPDQLAPIAVATGETRRAKVKDMLQGPVEHSSVAVLDDLISLFKQAKTKAALALKECGGDNRHQEILFHVTEAGNEAAEWKLDANGPQDDAPVMDGTGQPVLDAHRDIFLHGKLFHEAMLHVKRLNAVLAKITANPVVGVFATERQLDKTAFADLNNIREFLKFARPYAPCGYCAGKGGKCEACRGIGVVGKRVFEATPKGDAA